MDIHIQAIPLPCGTMLVKLPLADPNMNSISVT